MKKLTRALVEGLSALALVSAFGGIASAGAADLWKGYCFISSSAHPDYKHLESFAAKIEEISKGAIRTKINVGGSLPIPGTSITQAVGDGIITFAHDGFYTGNLPIGEITRLPLLLPDYETYTRARAKIEPVLAEALAKKGVTLLASYNFPMQTIWGVSKLTSTDDLAEMKIRVGNPPVAEFMKRHGAVGITLATADVAPALERSVVQGVVTASAGGGKLWGDMLKYNYRMPLNYDLMLVIANKAAFEKLPADMQEKIRAAARESADSLSAALGSMEDKVTEDLKAKGTVVTIPTAEEIASARKRMADYWQTWAEGIGPDAKALIAAVESEITK